MPKVYNIKDNPKNQENMINIMRPNFWGNPYVVGIDGTRKEVIEKYKNFVNSNPDMVKKAREELAGKDLLCCCKPKACHGDVLLEIANRGRLPYV